MELLTLPGHRGKHKRLFLCNMRKQRTHFDKAFKENAVKLSLERKNVSELAQELGIVPFLLYRWRKEFQQKGEMRLHVFEYIETWYNHKRRFWSLGNLTIDEFWDQYNLKKESIKNVA